MSPAAPLAAPLQAYFDKGVQAYTQGHYEYAMDLLAFVVKQVPDATEARRYLRLATQRQHSQSPPSIPVRVALMLLSVPVRCWLMLLSAQGQYRQAIPLYERMLCLQPRSRWLLSHLAATLHHAGLEEATLLTYTELLNAHPNHLPALRQLARLSMKRGDDLQARQCFERIFAVAPNDLEAQQGLRNLDALGTIKKGFNA